MGHTTDAIVIGGGLHGLSCALQLARAGRRVTLLERSWVGRHASTATAAGIRTLNRDRRELDICLESLQMWHRIEDLVGDRCGFVRSGQIRVAETVQDLDRETQRISHLCTAGYRHETIVDRDTLRTLLPSLSAHCVGAAVTHHDGAADPHKTVLAFRRAATEHGVTIHEGADVVAIRSCAPGWRVLTRAREISTQVVVAAAGAWTPGVAAQVGDHFPDGHKASMMIVTEKGRPFLGPVVGCIGNPLSLKQASNGSLLLGGGIQGEADPALGTSRVDFPRLAGGVRTALRLFPSLASVRIARCWTGIEAKTPDLLPVIGESPTARGIFYCFGFSGHGFELVPITGCIIADLVTAGRTARPVAALSPERLLTG
jgi:sarcosine oxidase, subunit beta